MTHPEELLAGYVDGTLPSTDRAVVDAHLAECARCRGEVAMASGARSVLVALPEVPAPPGVASRSLEEAGAIGRRRRADAAPRWYRFAGVAVAAAAALLVLTLVLPHIGGRPGGGNADRQVSEGVGAGLATNGAATAPAAGLEIQNANYDQAAITELTASYRPAAQSSPAMPVATAAASPKLGTAHQVTDALTCVAKATPAENGTLIRLIRARFEGTPAYIAVFLEGPGAGQPPDSVAVWVVSAKGCTILSSGYAKL
jgi:predicted anti-sigma-YlaC factor YlaD